MASPLHVIPLAKAKTILIPPFAMFIVIWITRYENPTSFPDMNIRLTFSVLLGLGMWHFGCFPSVKGQPWQYRLLIFLMLGFYFGAVVLLMTEGGAPQVTAKQFAVGSTIFGGALSIFYRSKSITKELTDRSIRGAILMLVLCHFVVYLNIFGAQNQLKGLFPAFLAFAGMAYAFKDSPKKNYDALQLLLTLTMFFLTVFQLLN
ncbi:hypothetical protein Q4544_09610 [Cognatishimia sp. 1_MG-2023]|uniref:hypothetical protein n=1 Tax=Cognatishimia sp. 1_MG-2023 TaxID=3062642 RepID=UPI0026E47565|nr:hypothetical protein [Cognatishimia sp. 1_MG-2023]MDO6727189.1 hypothetical protein [Cognatishimia sp. 1_MG-2023]